MHMLICCNSSLSVIRLWEPDAIFETFLLNASFCVRVRWREQRPLGPRALRKREAKTSTSTMEWHRDLTSSIEVELVAEFNIILRCQLIEAPCIGNPFLPSNPLCNWSHIWTVAIPIRAPLTALAETSWKGNLQRRPLMRFVTKVGRFASSRLRQNHKHLSSI